MNFPPALNPLRGTSFAWLFPLTWKIVKSAASAAPITLEVFLHHRFGARSGKSFVKAFLLLVFIAATSMRSRPTAIVPLFPGFLFAYVIAAFCHWPISQGQQSEQIHSFSSGEPWLIWQRLPVSTTVVKRYFEPALCFLISCVISILDFALGHWLLLASIALFIKGQVLRARLRARRLDAFDNRAETERLAPRARPESEPFVEARPAPPPPRPRAPNHP
jgi:hypothetical protein